MSASQVADMLKAKLEQRCTSLQAAFRKLDKSNTGFISPADFEDCLRDFNMRLTRQALAALVAKYDANGDGYVSYQEVTANRARTPGVSAENTSRQRYATTGLIANRNAHDIESHRGSLQRSCQDLRPLSPCTVRLRWLHPLASSNGPRRRSNASCTQRRPH